MENFYMHKVENPHITALKNKLAHTERLLDSAIDYIAALERECDALSGLLEALRNDMGDRLDMRYCNSN